MILPSAREWLPAPSLRARTHTTSISITGARAAEIRGLLDEVITVCSDRGLGLPRIALPQAFVEMLSERPLGEFGLNGRYRGVDLGIGALVDGPKAPILELAFNATGPEVRNAPTEPSIALTKSTLPDPGEWLPLPSLRTWVYQICMGLNAFKIRDFRNFLHTGIDVCTDRGLELRAIGVPQPALPALTEESLDSFGGKLRGLPLYVSAWFPFISSVEFEF